MAPVGEGTGGRVLAALAPAAMLAVDPAGWYPFGPIKWLVVPTLALAGAALVLREQPLRIDRPVGIAALALVVWLALSAALGEDPLYAWIGTPERRFGVATWALCALLLVVGSSLDARRDGPRLVRGLVVAGLGIGAVATVEALGWEPGPLAGSSRLLGPLGSSAYLGAATALLLPVTIAVALRDRSPGAGTSHDVTVPASRRRRLRPGPAVATVLLTIASLGSGARAAWVGLGVAALLAGLAARRQVVAMVRAHARIAAVGAAAAGIAVVALVVLSPVGDRVADLADEDSAGGAGRVDEWAIGLDVLAAHPLVGVGPEGYRTVFDEHVDEGYVVEHGRALQPDRAHSGPLDVALAGGLPALVAWAVVVAAVGRAAWRALRDGSRWQRGVAAGLVAHAVGQLFFFPVVELEPVAWLLAGLLVATRPRHDAARARDVPAVATAALAALAAVALVSGLTEVVADRRAERAADALGRGDGRAAVAAAESAVDLRPDVLRLHLLAAEAAVVGEQGFQAALDHADDALDLSPHDPVAELARLRYLVGRAEATGTTSHVEAAEVAVAERLADDPVDPRVWRLRAALDRLAGRAGAALEADARAEALTPEDQR